MNTMSEAFAKVFPMCEARRTANYYWDKLQMTLPAARTDINAAFRADQYRALYEFWDFRATAYERRNK